MNVLITGLSIFPSLRSITQIKCVLPEEDSGSATVVYAERESWTCTPEGDLTVLFYYILCVCFEEGIRYGNTF